MAIKHDGACRAERITFFSFLLDSGLCHHAAYSYTSFGNYLTEYYRVGVEENDWA